MIPPKRNPSPTLPASLGHVDQYLKRGFEKIDEDYTFLLDCLREVLHEIGHPTVARRLAPGLKSTPRLDQPSVQALSIVFQLLNLVEENTANQIARQRFASEGGRTMSGTWAQQIGKRCSPQQTCQSLAAHLAQTEVEIVLTAHPTESKKWSILDQHRELYLYLFELENRLYTKPERALFRTKIKNTLERLWRTGEIPANKPDVVAERQNVLYYLGEKFPKAIRLHDQRLRQTISLFEWEPEKSTHRLPLPRLTFGTWVGGDRDGHPFVTADLTRETFQILRQRAVQLVGASLLKLSQRLPLSSQNQPLSKRFNRRLKELRQSYSPSSRPPIAVDEPWREYVLSLRELLPRFDGEASPPTLRLTDLQQDLEILEESLREVGAGRLIEHELAPVQRELDLFGFHLARLDIRQNASYLQEAVSQLLKAAIPSLSAPFHEWDEDKKVAFLNQELKTLRPLTNRFTPLGPEATETLNCLRVCLKELCHYGRAGMGSIIVSMTRNLSDLLIVYLLCREVGLAFTYRKQPVCLLPIVPLFETKEDLERGPALLEKFLAHPLTKRSQLFWDRSLDNELCDAWLRKPQKPKPSSRPRQQVMVGYSDSNKDCGIIASLWAIRHSQIRLTEIGQRHNVDVQFFHGRGGTISRGAGPTHRFLDALPGATVAGGLRLTEQGETIGQKYSNELTAAHNLELLLAGTMDCHARPAETHENGDWISAMEQLSAVSSATYQQLIHRPGFEVFFYQATPIDVLQHSRIGSRPAARTGQRTVQDMRAIPWTFGWNQARFYLPGWFGAGTALETLHRDHRPLFESLTTEVIQVPFLRYLFFNLEASLESADVSIMSDYAQLVKNGQTRKRFLSHILEEHQKTKQWLQTLFKTPTKKRRPRFYRTLHARDRNLRLLHRHQIQLLKQWRKTKRESVLNELLVVVNAIASGQRTTG